MTKRRDRRLTQTIAYILSAIVAFSMILSLVGPLLLRATPQQPAPTPTWPPTWTPTTAPTPTPRAGADRVVFAVCGDSRETDAAYQRLLRQVVKDGNAFLVHTGNMVSTANPIRFAAFQSVMAGFELGFYPAPGSRDRGEDGTLVDFETYSGAPAAHYSFEVGPAHLAVVNSASGTLDAQELAWLDADLATTQQPVKLVVSHYPPFPLEGSAHALQQGGEALMSIATNRGVDAILAGRGAASHSQAEQDGVQIVLSGGTGAPSESPDTLYHYIQVTIEGTGISTRVVPLQ